MFVLSILKDTIPIHPSKFGVPPEQALTNELNKKYANRVLHDVGLCICVFDISEAGEGKVRYGDGFLWYSVVFRMTVFRPFPSEVILAKVKSSDEDGIQLSVGFFDDMWVPPTYLPQPSAFDPNERAHFWLPGSEATSAHEMLDTPLSDRMYIDQGEIVRVRVETDEFYDDEPGPPKATEGVKITVESRRPPYSVTCSIAEQGLGPTSWWKEAAAEAMDEG
ncbi:polymerase III polypeptide H [Amylostereum chailletii]|nr:polymerase III polypeptide H [Amylostereum chailletii]